MSPLRRLAPLCVLALAAGAVSLSQAQPAPPPAPPQVVVGPPPEESPPAAPAAEEPPPAALEKQIGAPPPGAPGPAPTLLTDDVKEKPAATTPLPEKPPTPLKRPRQSQAIIQALDKVTAQTVRFPADVNKPVRWKDLVFTVKACETPADDEPDKGAFAHMEIYSEPRTSPGRTPPPPKLVYRGWMYAEAPAVHAFEHPIYDVWLIACRTA